MKNNRKNRKRKFIKIKNDLRLGITKFYCSEKVSNEIKEDGMYWERLTETAIHSLLLTYKLKLRKITIIPNHLIGDDFVMDLHTNCVCLSN